MAITKAITNLFLLSPPKTGSTSLFFDLVQHPNIVGCSVKEPHFFLQDRDVVEKDIDKYNLLFLDNNLYRMEATTNYFHQEIALKNIKEFCNDNIKFIVVLRSPVKRLISEYIHKRSIHLILSDEQIHQKFRSEMDWVETWDKQISNKFGRGEKRNLETIIRHHKQDNRYSYYFNIGNYYLHLEKLYQYFDHNQIKIILYENFKDDNSYWLSEICKFLQLPEFDFVYKEVNQANYWLKYVNCSHEIQDTHIQYIKDYYKNSNNLLEKILNIKLNWNE